MTSNNWRHKAIFFLQINMHTTTKQYKSIKNNTFNMYLYIQAQHISVYIFFKVKRMRDNKRDLTWVEPTSVHIHRWVTSITTWSRYQYTLQLTKIKCKIKFAITFSKYYNGYPTFKKGAFEVNWLIETVIRGLDILRPGPRSLKWPNQ